MRLFRNLLPAPWTKPKKLHAALLSALGFHGGLLASGSYRGTYDAYVHIFFADHYRRGWFETWEPRWYTGFSTTGYPPGTHQLIALLSGLIGLEMAFAVVQLVAVLGLVVGVYRFSCLWVHPTAAGWAALGAVASSSVAEVVHVFGQLPTTMALALLLNAQPSIRRWIHRGGFANLGLAIALLAATTAVHHVTTLFGSVFFSGPIVVQAILDRWGTPLDSEVTGHPEMITKDQYVPIVARRLRRVLAPVMRSGVLVWCTIVVLVFVVLAYWLWTSGDPITQVPIPHGSRSDFLDDTAAGLAFFVLPWSSLVLLLPFLIPRLVRVGQWPLAWSVAILTLLGTGGTTPIPRALLGGAFEILTLDRFTIWATVAFLPFAGEAMVSLRSGAANQWLRNHVGAAVPRVVQASVCVLALASTLFAASFGQFRPLQPDPIDPLPVTEFLAKDQHHRWRYLTLGFGDQMAWLSANTTALSVDGNYHSARRLPELTTRAVERLEGAKFRGVHGLGSLQQFVGHPARYHLKFVFSADEFYDPLLWANGWHRLGRLSNGVMVWEKSDVPPLPDILPSKQIPGWQQLLWGLAPLTALGAAVFAMGVLSFGPAERSHLTGPLWRNSPRAGDKPFGSLPAPRFAVGRWLDWRLERCALQLRPGPDRRRWNPLSLLSDRVCSVLIASPTPARRRAQQLLLGCLALYALSVLHSLSALTPLLRAGHRAPDGPDEVMTSYYDHLDFRRFGAAYDLLAPDSPASSTPSELEWNLERSVRDGLFDGYAKLDSILATTLKIDESHASVRVDLVYLTSLEQIDVQRVHYLTRHEGHWRIEADQRRLEVPPEPFTDRTSIDYLAQGRRQIGEGQTALADVLDRPVIAIPSARVVRFGGRLCVVGTIINLDVDPADVTIDVVLRDATGVKLAEYSAATIAVHKVLPGEEVPFRVELEGRAGVEATTNPASPGFAPESFNAPLLASEIHLVEVGARAVVAHQGLARDLAIQRATVTRTQDGQRVITGQIRNDGVRTATVPHVLVTIVGDDGRVLWVDHLWLSSAVRAQRHEPFELTLTNPALIHPVDVPVKLFANGQNTVVATKDSTVISGASSLPGAADLRLTILSFYRSGQS